VLRKEGITQKDKESIPRLSKIRSQNSRHHLKRLLIQRFALPTPASPFEDVMCSEHVRTSAFGVWPKKRHLKKFGLLALTGISQQGKAKSGGFWASGYRQLWSINIAVRLPNIIERANSENMGIRKGEQE